MAVAAGRRPCGVCGAPARPPFQAPPAEQAPDLDLRPGEPGRSTLPFWIQTCRACQAAAPDLGGLRPDAPVRDPVYRALRDEPRGSLAPRRWAMLCPESERHEALLWAAWAADDAGDDVAARHLRRAALAVWPDPAADDGTRRIDVLRRAGLLTEAAAACDAATQADPAVLAFQRARIAAGDTGRHLLSSALRPPARLPHVAHGPKTSGGFWKRLRGE